MHGVRRGVARWRRTVELEDRIVGADRQEARDCVSAIDQNRSPRLADRFTTRAEARLFLFEWFEVFYNRQRHQAALGHRSPVEYAATFSSS